jgi:Domain of unknown function (DUF4112)
MGTLTEGVKNLSSARRAALAASASASGPGAATILETPETAQDLRRLETLATWLDRRFLDPILGFFLPGAGDTFCSLLGLYGVFVAIKIGVHPVVVARMLVNLSIDAVFGGVPFLGVIFDLFYRAHVRNLDLIKSRGTHGVPLWSDWAIVLGAALLFVISLLLPLIVIGLLIAFVVQLLQS